MMKFSSVPSSSSSSSSSFWICLRTFVLLFLTTTTNTICVLAQDLNNNNNNNNSPSFCVGPKTPGELRMALWASDNVNYDKFARPGIANATTAIGVPPDVARVQMHVLSLTDLDQKRNEFQLNVWFRRRWNDYRLKYDGLLSCFPQDDRQGFATSILNEIWKPDIFIENQVRINSEVAGSVWIYPNGDVVHVSQLLITLACSMNFQNFPYDSQNCAVKMGTFLEDAQEVTLDFWQDIDPVTVAAASKQAADGTTTKDVPHGGSNEWDIVKAQAVIANEGVQHGAIQAESSVELQFELKRRADYYSDFVIIPTLMFVTIGWASFFVSRTQAPARVAMSIIGFLANTNFLAAQLGQLPRLGNDVWLLKFMQSSSLFSFYAVIEYVICNHLLRIEARVDGARKRALEHVMAQKKKQKSIKTRQKMTIPNGNDDDDDDDDVGVESSKRSSSRRRRSKKEQSPSSPQDTAIMEDFDDNDSEEPIVLTKQDLHNVGFHYKLDGILLNQKGEMRFRDQHIDIFSRYAYPVAYGAMCLVLFYF